MSDRTPTHKVLIYVSGQKTQKVHMSSASSSTALIPPLQTRDQLRRHQGERIVIRRRAVCEMCRVVVNIQHELGNVLSCDTDVTVCHCQYGMSIRRRPQRNLLHRVTSYSVQRKGVECRQQAGTSNTQVRDRRTRRHMLWCRGP